jgi:chromosomal replication initiation ATPase DnaA
MREGPGNLWSAVLEHVRAEMDAEDFRRWFGATAYASDSGDQITVWVPTEAMRRHIMLHFQDMLDRAVEAAGRRDTHIRFVVSGVSDDEDEE